MDPNILFYIALILTSAIALINAGLAYKTSDAQQAYRISIFAIAILSVCLSICVASSEHNQAKRSDDTASHYRELHTRLALNQIDSSRKIIDTLDSTIIHSRTLLSQNNKILFDQKSSLTMATKNLNIANSVQNNVVRSGNKLLSTINLAEKTITDNLTGGKGFVTLEIKNFAGKTVLGISNKDDTHLPSVTVVIFDLSNFQECLKTHALDTVKMRDCESLYHYSVPSQPIYPWGTAALDPLEIDLKNSVLGKIVEFDIIMPNKRYKEQMWYQIQKNSTIKYRYRLMKLIKNMWVPYYFSADFDNVNDTKKFDKLFYGRS